MLNFTAKCTENECHFDNCPYNSENNCTNYEHRLDCLSIYLRIFCAEDQEKTLIEKISKKKKEFLNDE